MIMLKSPLFMASVMFSQEPCPKLIAFYGQFSQQPGRGIAPHIIEGDLAHHLSSKFGFVEFDRSSLDDFLFTLEPESSLDAFPEALF